MQGAQRWIMGWRHLGLLQRVERIAGRTGDNLIRDANSVVADGQRCAWCFLCERHCGRRRALLRRKARVQKQKRRWQQEEHPNMHSLKSVTMWREAQGSIFENQGCIRAVFHATTWKLVVLMRMAGRREEASPRQRLERLGAGW